VPGDSVPGIVRCQASLIPPCTPRGGITITNGPRGETGEPEIVRRRRIGGQDAAPRLEGQDRDDLSVLGAKALRDAPLPRRKRDRRNRPEIGLEGTLKITLVVKPLDRRVGRTAVGQVVSKFERSYARVDLL
jgi:hypothetical protein